MTSVRKATGSGAGCAALTLAAVFGLLGFAFPPLWIIALPAGVIGLYYGNKSQTVWRCSVCRVTIHKG